MGTVMRDIPLSILIRYVTAVRRLLDELTPRPEREAWQEVMRCTYILEHLIEDLERKAGEHGR
jgi:hypothetical protein